MSQSDSPPPPAPDAAAILAEAAASHRAGNLADAERRYRFLLCHDPANAAVMPLHAVLLHQTARPAAACAWARRGVQLRPESHAHLAAYGHLLLEQDRPDAAVAPLQQALARHPQGYAPYNNLALALNRLDRDAATMAAHGDRAAVAARATEALNSLIRDPADLAALVTVGPLLERLDAADRALAVYRHTVRLRPEHSRSFSRAAMLRLRAAWGLPQPPVGRDDRPAVTLSTLGDNGRFGNQVIQYGFLRCYAAEHDLRPETADWIGRDLFDLTDPIAVPGLPELSEGTLVTAQTQAGTPWVRIPDHDLTGLFAGQQPYFARHRTLLQRLLAPGRRAAARLEPALNRLRGDGVLVALHLRRGDALRFPADHPFHRHFWIAPEAWYLSWLQQLWSALSRPVLYIASDQPGIEAAFAAFSPRTARDLHVDLPGAGFYPDFFMLTRADVLIGSNSTFSTTAALLNDRAALFLRPDAQARGLVPYQPSQGPLLPGL